MIRLRRKQNGNLRLETLKPTDKDLDRLSFIPEKRLISKREDGIDIWDHWEIPWEDLKEITEKWPENQIVMSEQVKELYDRYLFEMTPYEDLPRISGNIFTSKELKDYQDLYVRLTRKCPRTINSFDVGLGKSLTSLERARRFQFTRMLIVTPQTQLDGWVEEAREAYNLEPCVYFGDKKERQRIMDTIGECSIVIATYETVSELDPDDFLFDSFIFDEAHLWSNPDTQRYKDLEKMFQATWERPGICVQVLTATPIGNRIASIWPLLHLVSPLVAGSRRAFRDEHEQVETFGYRNFTEVDEEGNVTKEKLVTYAKKVVSKNLDKLAAKVAATVARMSGELVYEFRNSIKYTNVDLTPDQLLYYQEARDGLLDEFNTSRLGLKNAQVKMLRLLQISEGTFNDPDWKLGDEYESAKLQHTIRILNRRINKGQKTVIWSRFKKAGRILESLYPDYCVVYDGDQSNDMKRLVKWAFQGVKHVRDYEKYCELRAKINRSRKAKGEPLFEFEPGEAQVFAGVIDLRSALGMNLQKCNYQIFLSWSFSCIAVIQAAGRIIRLGQEASTVITEFLIANDTWETIALQYILGLYEIAKSVLDGKESLSNDSVIKLLNFLRRERHKRA